MADYFAKLEGLGGLEYRGIKPGLSRIRGVLEKTGMPHEKFPCIHIAGTNGKGSTAAFVSWILETAGYRTGLYTSPHLVSQCERISINSRDITRDELAAAARSPWKYVREFSLTYFELFTAIAFGYFADKKVDVAVIEVGLGGRYDATNVIRNPLASIITDIDYDHTELLGKKLVDISSEKAGIIKDGSPVVTSNRNGVAMRVISGEASRHKCDLYRLGRDFFYKQGPVDWQGLKQKFSYRDTENSYENLQIALPGSHQVKNCSLALMCSTLLKNQGLRLAPGDIRAALKRVTWPGRFEVHGKIVLDGAHNPRGITELMGTLKEYSSFLKSEGIAFIISIMKEKDYRKIIRQVVKHAKKIILYKLKNERAVQPGVLRMLVESVAPGLPVVEAGSFDEAVRAVKDEKLVCVTGSLYMVGEWKKQQSALT